MTCQGIVKDGVIVLPPGVTPPEGAEVTVTLVNEAGASATQGKKHSAESLMLKNGVPVFDPVEGAPEATLELVRRLRDELP